jgi:hypothetical protein
MAKKLEINGFNKKAFMSEIFFPEMCIVESSADISVLQFEILKGRSLDLKKGL